MKTTSSWGLVLPALVSSLWVMGCTQGNGPLLARPNTQAVKSQSARQALGGTSLSTSAQWDAPVIDANSSAAPPFGTGSYSVAPSTSGGNQSLGAIDASSSPAFQYVIVGDLTGAPQNFFAVIADVPFTVGAHAIDNVHFFAGLFDAATGNPTHLASQGTVTFTTAGGVGGRFVGSFSGALDEVATAGCQSTADCAAGEICSNGTCVTSPPPQCRVDTDCARGQVCQSGLCVTSTPPPQCSSDADCAAGQSCQAGQCVSAPPPQCLVDADCGAGGTCQSGVCVTQPPQCTSSAQCPFGWSCTRGQCVPGSTPSQCEGQQGDGSLQGQVGTVASCAALPAGAVSLSQGVAVIDDQLRLVVFDANSGDEGVMLELAMCPGAPGTLTLGQGLVAASHVKDVQTADLRLFAERRASSASLTLTTVSPSLAGSFSLTLATGGQVSGAFTMY